MADNSRKKKRKAVVDVLNKARGMELQAIAQYMNQHYGLDDMDYGELAKQIKLIALDEMRHAESFAERIKELEGEPTTEKAGKVEREQEVEAVFPFDCEQEEDAINAYNEFAQVCRDNGDSTTAQLFDQVIDEEQEHLNYFDSVRGHIEKLGPAFLAQKAGTPSAANLNSPGFVTKQPAQ